MIVTGTGCVVKVVLVVTGGTVVVVDVVEVSVVMLVTVATVVVTVAAVTVTAGAVTVEVGWVTVTTAPVTVTVEAVAVAVFAVRVAVAAVAVTVTVLQCRRLSAPNRTLPGAKPGPRSVRRVATYGAVGETVTRRAETQSAEREAREGSPAPLLAPVTARAQLLA